VTANSKASEAQFASALLIQEKLFEPERTKPIHHALREATVI
jgi:hypothetical protein